MDPLVCNVEGDTGFKFQEPHLWLGGIAALAAFAAKAGFSPMHVLDGGGFLDNPNSDAGATCTHLCALWRVARVPNFRTYLFGLGGIASLAVMEDKADFSPPHACFAQLDLS